MQMSFLMGLREDSVSKLVWYTEEGVFLCGQIHY